MTIGFRDFFQGIGWWGDRGRPLEWSPILEAIAEGLESSGQIAILSSRRGGKSSGAAVAAAWAAVAIPGSFTLWIAATGGQVQDIFSQKFIAPLRANPKLRGLDLDVARDRVFFRESGSTVVCVAPSEASIVGRTISGVLVVDECRSVDAEIIDLLAPSVLGTGRTILIGSAGRPGSWWHQRFAAPEPGDFVRVFRTLEDAGNPALCTPEVRADLERERKRAEVSGWKSALWRREHQSEWTTLSDNPLVAPEAVERAAVDEIEPFDVNLDECFMSIDLSVTRDLTSIAVCAVRDGGPMRIVELWSWDPKASGRVPYDAVEAKIVSLERRYSPTRILGDRYQLVALATNLRKRDIHVEEIAVTPGVNQAIFTALSEALEENRLRWKRGAHARLEEEIRSLEIEETQGGFKVLDGGRHGGGPRLHRDESFAVSLAVWAASKSRGVFPRDPRTWGFAERERKSLEILGTDWRGNKNLRRVESSQERVERECREAQLEFDRAIKRVLG